MMDDFRYHFKRGLPFIITILLLLLVPAYIFFRKNGFLFFENKIRIEELLSAKQDKIHIADSLKRNENETKVAGGIQQDSLGKNDKDEQLVFEEDINGTYHIIVGSFTNPENAKLAAGKYRSRRYKTSIIYITGKNGVKTELVSVKSFNNLNEATRYLKEFQSKFDPKAWPYSHK